MARDAPVRVTPVIGETVSRYAEDSYVRRILELIEPTNAPVIWVADGFRFTHESADRNAEAAFAMAASFGVQDIVTGTDIHECFCPGRPGPCDSQEFSSPRDQACGFRISAQRFGPVLKNREEALANCRERKDQWYQWLFEQITRRHGVVVSVFARNAFPDVMDDTDPNASVHAFALYGVEQNGSLLLRDGADRVPVTYRLSDDKICDALVGPEYLLWGKVQRDYEEWSLRGWVIVPTESRRASVGPMPLVTDRTFCPAKGELPSVIVPGTPSEDPFNLGVWALPDDTPALKRQFRTWEQRPSRFLLGIGVGPSARDASVSWLQRLERDGMALRLSANSFSSSWDGAALIEEAYRLAGRMEREALRALAAHFTCASGILDGDRDWTARQVITFVQSIPYELIREDALGLRTPVSVLYEYAGDCDSKSLLAAVLLLLTGRETSIVYSFAARHAVLGIVAPSWSGTSIRGPDGKRYVMVEMTERLSPGDMSHVGLSEREDPRQKGWKAVPLNLDEVR